MGRGDSKRLAVTGKHEHAHAAAPRGHRDKEAPLLQCTTHMCPVRVHWHVKLNYKEYWRAKIAITNFNYHMNYTQWTLVAQHPNLDNITEVFSFDYKPVVAYGSISNSLPSLSVLDHRRLSSLYMCQIVDRYLRNALNLGIKN
jgi:hypothetical protein